MTDLPLTAAEIPLPEDAWTSAPQVPENLRQAWFDWLHAPRYRLWEAESGLSCFLFKVPCPFHDAEGEGRPLLQLLRTLASGHVSGWAVNRENPLLLEFRDDRVQGFPRYFGGNADRLNRRLRQPDWQVARRYLEHPGRWKTSDEHYPFAEKPRLKYEGKSDFELEGIELIRQARSRGCLSWRDSQRLQRAISQREQALHGRVRSWLMGHLDAGMLDALRRRAVSPTPQFYNWVAVASGEERRRRLQALQAAPWLIEAALDDTWGPEKRPELERVVREGLPLYPALAEWFGIKESTVRRMRAVRPALYRSLRRIGFNGVAPWLDHLPPERWPSGIAEWEKFCLITHELHVFVRDMDGYFPEGRKRLTAKNGAASVMLRELARLGWEDALAQLNGMAGDERIWDCEPILGAIQAVTGTSQADDDEPAILPEQAWPLLDWPLSRWAKALRRFRAARQEFVKAAADDRAEAKFWPPLLPPTRMGEREIVFLESSSALEEEGAAMQHCVANRVEDCHVGRSHIASLRDAAGSRMSTLEVVLEEKSGRWIARIGEHKGMGNEPVSPECASAARELKRRLARADLGSFEAERRKREQAVREKEAASRQFRLQADAHALERILPPEMWRSLCSGWKPEPAFARESANDCAYLLVA